MRKPTHAFPHHQSVRSRALDYGRTTRHVLCRGLALLACFTAASILAGCRHPAPGSVVPDYLQLVQKAPGQAPTPVRESATGAPDQVPAEVEEAKRILAPHRSEDGRTVRLPLRDAILLALKYNSDVAAERLNPQMADESVIQALAGFDPSLSSKYSMSRSESPSASDGQLTSSVSRSRSAELTLSKDTALGTTFSTGIEGSRGDAEKSDGLDPDYSTDLFLSVKQPLLRGFGPKSTKRDIIVARNDRQRSVESFRQELMDTVQSVERTYWNLYFAIQDLQVRRGALKMAQTVLDNENARFAVGEATKLDVSRALTAAERRKTEIINAENTVRNRVNELKRLLNCPGLSLRDLVTIVPADEPVVVPYEAEREAGIRTALQFRPDLRRSRLEAENRELDLAYRRNQEWPQLDLSGRAEVHGIEANPGNSLDVAATRDYYDWSLSLTLSTPLGNRSRRSQRRRAALRQRQARENLRALEDKAVLEVEKAYNGLITARLQIAATRRAHKAAQERLEGERAMVAEGAATNEELLRAQDDSARAESAARRALADYLIAIGRLEQTKGTLLQYKNIYLKREIEGR